VAARGRCLGPNQTGVACLPEHAVRRRGRQRSKAMSQGSRERLRNREVESDAGESELSLAETGAEPKAQKGRGVIPGGRETESWCGRCRPGVLSRLRLRGSLQTRVSREAELA